MIINDNGIARDMTPEEIAEMDRMQAEMPVPASDPMQEQIDDLWLAMAEMQLGGEQV